MYIYENQIFDQNLNKIFEDSNDFLQKKKEKNLESIFVED